MREAEQCYTETQRGNGNKFHAKCTRQQGFPFITAWIPKLQQASKGSHLCTESATHPVDGGRCKRPTSGTVATMDGLFDIICYNTTSKLATILF